LIHKLITEIEAI